MLTTKKYALLLLSVVSALFIWSYVYNTPIKIWDTSPDAFDPLYTSRRAPDNIILVPTNDMARTVKISWRTSTAVNTGSIEYAPVSDDITTHHKEQKAHLHNLYSRELTADKKIHCYAAELTDLIPGTTYRYRVGSPEDNIWSDYKTFDVAPEEEQSFSFVYIGDTQKAPDKVGNLLNSIDNKLPQTAFYMIGGDLVEKGGLRNLWDDLLAGCAQVFSHKPLVPAMGNHDFGRHKTGMKIFSTYFAIPMHNDPLYEKNTNYSFHYNNTLFLVVNASEGNLGQQTFWLEQELEKADKGETDFIIVMCHFPVYNSKEGRSNKVAQEKWVPLFDKYGVDIVLSGHDHAYLRTKKLIGGVPESPLGHQAGSAQSQRQDKPQSQSQSQTQGYLHPHGTTYITATGCERFYPYQPLSFAEKQLANTVTYQHISINKAISERPTLDYTAFSEAGDIIDQFSITLTSSKRDTQGIFGSL